MLCRICYESSGQVISACQCTGSLLYHANCMEKWLKQQNTNECEICKDTIRMRKKYCDLPKVSNFKKLKFPIDNIFQFILCIFVPWIHIMVNMVMFFYFSGLTFTACIASFVVLSSWCVFLSCYKRTSNVVTILLVSEIIITSLSLLSRFFYFTHNDIIDLQLSFMMTTTAIWLMNAWIKLKPWYIVPNLQGHG